MGGRPIGIESKRPSTPVERPMNYRSIWISDLHLGSRHSQAESLLAFLKNVECEHLYLVGDIVDGWELRRRWWWDTHANTVVQKVLRLNRKQTQVTYLIGNHDEFLGDFLGLDIGGVALAERVVHEAADGRRYLVMHGHQLDGLVYFNRLLERVGSRLYDWILEFNLHFNRVRRRLGFGYWSVSAQLKLQAKSAVRYITRYEEGMVHMARQAGVSGIICGHIHRAEMRRVDDILYLNCGDWVESCTALVEDFEGAIHLIRLTESGFETVALERQSPSAPAPQGGPACGNPIPVRKPGLPVSTAPQHA